MKPSFLLTIFFLSFSSLYSAENPPLSKSPFEQNSIQTSQDELEIIENLLEVTQRRLEEQQNLCFLIRDFKKYRKSFMADSNNKETALALISTANQLLNKLNSNHFDYLFNKEFLEELNFFASIVNKTSTETL